MLLAGSWVTFFFALFHCNFQFSQHKSVSDSGFRIVNRNSRWSVSPWGASQRANLRNKMPSPPAASAWIEFWSVRNVSNKVAFWNEPLDRFNWVGHFCLVPCPHPQRRFASLLWWLRFVAFCDQSNHARIQFDCISRDSCSAGSRHVFWECLWNGAQGFLFAVFWGFGVTK